MNAPRLLLLAALSVPLLLSAPALAQSPGSELSIRLVAAAEAAAGIDPALADVLPLLRRNLRYKSYRQLAAKTASLRSGTRIRLAAGYQVFFVNVASSELTVRVAKEDKTLINTRLTLRRGKPVILGGFPEGKKTLLIILVLSAG